jgi:hypothetical protein
MRCSERFLRELVANHQIPHTIFAGKVLFYQDKLDELLMSLEVPVNCVGVDNQQSDAEPAKGDYEIIPDCDQNKVGDLIQEMIERNEHFVTGLGKNLQKDLEERQYKTLSCKVYSQLSRWCWPNRNSSREEWVKPRARQISKLLFGRVIDRTRHPHYHKLIATEEVQLVNYSM